MKLLEQLEKILPSKEPELKEEPALPKGKLSPDTVVSDWKYTIFPIGDTDQALEGWYRTATRPDGTVMLQVAHHVLNPPRGATSRISEPLFDPVELNPGQDAKAVAESLLRAERKSRGLEEEFFQPWLHKWDPGNCPA